MIVYDKDEIVIQWGKEPLLNVCTGYIYLALHLEENGVCSLLHTIYKKNYKCIKYLDLKMKQQRWFQKYLRNHTYNPDRQENFLIKIRRTDTRKEKPDIFDYF